MILLILDLFELKEAKNLEIYSQAELWKQRLKTLTEI